MSPRTLYLVGGQLLSLGVIGWLWGENRDLRASPAYQEAARRPFMASERSTNRRDASDEPSSAPAKYRSTAAVEKDAEPKSRQRPHVDAASDGGAVLRWPGGRRSVDLSNEDVVALEQELRAARVDATAKAPGGPSWSPGQAAGAPDTTGHGDFRTAWASAEPDGGKEWVQMSYAEPTEIGEVVIHESYNPGAVSRVLALMPDGSEQVLWEGTQEPVEAGRVSNSVFKVPPGVRSDRIRVELDTARVPGWNEIDAVELVGSDGRRQWATESTASSFYGQDRQVAANGGAGWYGR